MPHNQGLQFGQFLAQQANRNIRSTADSRIRLKQLAENIEQQEFERDMAEVAKRLRDKRLQLDRERFKEQVAQNVFQREQRLKDQQQEDARLQQLGELRDATIAAKNRQGELSPREKIQLLMQGLQFRTQLQQRQQGLQEEKSVLEEELQETQPADQPERDTPLGQFLLNLNNSFFGFDPAERFPALMREAKEAEPELFRNVQADKPEKELTPEQRRKKEQLELITKNLNDIQSTLDLATKIVEGDVSQKEINNFLGFDNNNQQ